MYFRWAVSKSPFDLYGFKSAFTGSFKRDSEASFCRQGFKLSDLKNFAIFTGTCNAIKKETPTQLFFREYCKSFKNRLFYKTPLLPASGDYEVAQTLRGVHGRYPQMVLQTFEKFL